MNLQISNNKKRIAIVCLAVVMCLSMALTSFASASDNAVNQTEQIVSFQNVTGQVNLSHVRLDNLSDYVMANVDMNQYEEHTVIVSLKEKNLVQSAEGNLLEYISSKQGQLQRDKIYAEQEEFLSNLTELNIDYQLVANYDAVLNGVAIKINTAYVSLIKLLPNVSSVVLSQTYLAPQTVTDTTSASDITNQTSVYQTGIYDSSKYAEEYGGKGMLVAVLDTGLDYTHEAFQTQPTTLKYNDEYSVYYNQEGVAEIMSKESFSARGNVYVSDKVPFAYDYADRDADVYPSYSNHGTHVAGIIAGSADSYTDKDGNVAKDENGNAIAFNSVAPNAQLAICKVFTDNLDSKNVGGATTQDIVDALNDCVKLGVDVINMSLGTTCGFSSTDDGDDEGAMLQEVYQAIQDAGISLVCAASNDYSSAYGGAFGTNLTSNPDSGTVGSPSTFAAALSVASISGKKSPFILANGTTAVFYNESSNENNVDYDFAEDMLKLVGSPDSANFNYVVIKGTYYGSSADYNTNYVKRAIQNAHDNNQKIIALVKRGGNLTFQEKVENAMSAGADAVIVYNNVAGEIKMTIGDVDDPIPAISISYEAGKAMVDGATNNIGTITINPTDYLAGPFMSNFSSWGVTSDLKLKPEITAHGGEITSSVPGGWDEQSGTSMATPNVAGLVANVRSYIATNWNKFFTNQPTSVQITQLANQLMMSTATIVVDQKGLAYSPRKQGAGLASLENIIDKTGAYIFTLANESIQSAHGVYSGAEDNRPKIELGEDQDKVGQYTMKFYVANVNDQKALNFQLNAILMTETVSLAGLSVGEQAYILDDNKNDWVWSVTVGGQTVTEKTGDQITIPANSTAEISVTLTLSDAEKQYLDTNFKNGMYVEGFLQLLSQEENQCNLNLPFLGFYGDWESAPMLDYDAFEIAEFEQDTSILDEEKPKASVWATQAYSIYWNDKYVLPMGSYVYKQNEDDDEVRKIYTTEEYSAISCYNEYNGEDSNNYMTSTGIKGIYAGLLRNARQVDCRMYNVATGELMYQKEIYRVNKAYSNGGSTTPGFVKLELTPEELGLVENGQYRMEFDFYYHTPTEQDKANLNKENTFTFSFYVDYTAPVLEQATVRYFDYKDGNKEKQKIYLDLEVYDNHYSMAALLCYLDTTDSNNPELQLCTEYVTPIYDAVKNGTTKISIEITDILQKYGNNLYVELDDYALNHSVWQINISDAQKSPLPSSFNLAEGEEEITIGKFETHKVSLVWDKTLYPYANLSNFTWTVSGQSSAIVAVKNGEIVGLSAGVGKVSVSNGKVSKDIQVTVTDSDKTLNKPSISFDVILNGNKAPVKAQGMVEVDIEQNIQLEIVTDPWYYPINDEQYNLALEWSSSAPSVATVDQDGQVKLLKKGRTTIVATIQGTAYSAMVMLSVQEPFKVSNYSLTGYEGNSKVVYIPTDMNIMSIGEKAFENNTTIETVIIPKTVTTIDARAFYGCTSLKQVFFVDVQTQEIAEADLTLINREAFYGCTALEYLDFSNCKTFTVARQAFAGCVNLKLIKGVEHIGTAYDQAFEGCSSLVGSVNSQSGVTLATVTERDEKENNAITAIQVVDFDNLKDKEGNDLVVESLDISGLHVAGAYVFKDCTALNNITTDKFTALGNGMFFGCKGIQNVTLSGVNSIGAYAFEKCYGLTSVTLDAQNVVIGQGAFSNCGNLRELIYTANATISNVGSYAFANTSLSAFELPNNQGQLAVNVVLNSDILLGSDVAMVAFTQEQLAKIQFVGNPFNGITVKVGSVLEDAIYLGTKLVYVNPNATTLTIANGTTEIGDYAFANSKIKEIVIPSSVTVIGDGAFQNSALEKVTFQADSQLSTIGDYAFYGTKIKQIQLPASLKDTFDNDGNLIAIALGNYAFANSSLAEFQLDSVNQITFGNYVFANCQSLVNVDLSQTNVTAMGSGTFANAISLNQVYLPSLKKLGLFTFMGATNISNVVFGENSTTTGNYTFFTYSNDGGVVSYENLTNVTIGAKTTEIGSNAFVGCTSLSTFDLRNAKVVGELAFYGCLSLADVNGLDNVTYVGDYAFYNCKALTNLSLYNVLHIGNGAFRIDRDESEKINSVDIEMPKVQTIGAYAFYGVGAHTITLPSTLTNMQQEDVYNIDGVVYGQKTTQPIGVGAFSNMPLLTEISVDQNNTLYVDFGGVLYRYVTNYNVAENTYDVVENSYELVAYPALYQAVDYVIKAGTVRVQAYAFAGATLLNSVTIPYSVATLGAGAFFDTSVSLFNFDSHIAPTLESEFDELLKAYLRTDISFRGMLNNNFVSYVIEFTDEVTNSSYTNISTLSMNYPTNGDGYGNYLYKKYFTVRKQSGYVLTNDARTVQENIVNMPHDLQTVQSWLENSFEVNATNKTTVESFAEYVKQTHSLYNNLSNDKEQVKLIGQDNVDKMFQIEEVLRQVKTKFNVSVKATGYSFGGNYKRNYVEGDFFDMTNLVITIVYDDYSTQEFTGSQLKLAEVSNKPLTSLDRTVQIECNGKTYKIDVRVSAQQTEPTQEPEQNQNNGLVFIIIGSVVGGLAIIGAVVLIVLKSKGIIKPKSSTTSNDDTQTLNDENQE